MQKSMKIFVPVALATIAGLLATSVAFAQQANTELEDFKLEGPIVDWTADVSGEVDDEDMGPVAFALTPDTEIDGDPVVDRIAKVKGVIEADGAYTALKVEVEEPKEE